MPTTITGMSQSRCIVKFVSLCDVFTNFAGTFEIRIPIIPLEQHSTIYLQLPKCVFGRQGDLVELANYCR
jgi:hypothetical protein